MPHRRRTQPRPQGTARSASLIRRGRQLASRARRADSIVCGVGPLDTLPGQVIGAKPAVVCRWIFTLPGDMLDDLFPGSGAVGRTFASFIRRGKPSPPVAMTDPSACARRVRCRGRPLADASSPAAVTPPYLSSEGPARRLPVASGRARTPSRPAVVLARRPSPPSD